jgi:CheY-like chemotaxis protein
LNPSAGACTNALAMLAADRFDLLVADIGLPDGSGLDLMRRGANPQIKGIALTGRDAEQDVADALAAGFSLHLTKPTDFNSLKKAVEKVLAAGSC